MTTIQFRRALLGMAVTAGIFALAAPMAFAMPQAPPAAPKCGSGAGLMNFAITTTPPSPPGTTTGRNFVSIQRVSPINGSPANLSNNGFIKLCQRLDRPGGLAFDVNGDSITDTGSLTQYDPLAGLVNSHDCAASLASSEWDEGQGVEIRVNLGGGLGATDISLVIPGVECSQKFAAYKNVAQANAKGKLYFPIPNSTTCTERGCICDQLNLPNGSVLLTVNTAPPTTGSIETYNCVTPRDLDGNPPLRVGEAALIFGSNAPGGGTTTEGRPVNCLTPGANPLPCPTTPNANYPAPLIY